LPDREGLVTFEDQGCGLKVAASIRQQGRTTMTEASIPDLESPTGVADMKTRSTLLQYVKARRIRLSPKELSLAGQVLAARCRAQGIDLPKVKERGGWRQTNLYPRSLLEAWEEHRQAWEAEWHEIRAARREVRSQEGGTEGLDGEPSPADAARN
jgi:hypothetical protein